MPNESGPVTNPDSTGNIGSAAAGMAHDINNQLTIIVNHLSTQDRTPSIVAALEAVNRCADLAASLLSRAHGETVQLRPHDLSAFLSGFIAKLHLPEGVRLITGLPASLPPIAADPLALGRALTNLISNACAAMNNNGTLRIATSPCQIDIEDSGPGIPAADRARIFDPFFTTKGERGTGLGLSIVRDIMHGHGGSVTVESEPGRGTRFTLRFRAAGEDYGVTGFNASPRKIAPAA
ncbi:MAG TPA: ATP-binding protein [Bryobacteraceae bacterium]|jgi:two-component system NtrC family sensor kinase|nr:ATP-binding protein [Bryobacteraceae bacterium]